jgi:uncharacterized protein YqeY
MTLQQQIKKDLTSAMKARDEETKSTLRVVMGEFARADKKELSDEDVIKVLKKLIKSEKETLAQQGDEESSPFIRTIETYLPQMATDSEIGTWINEHVDFKQFKNKMQAMGPIMKHFGPRADGNTVKSILQKL